MRGPIPGVDPLLAPILYSFQQAREDLARWTEGLTLAELWATHARLRLGRISSCAHIAGSTDRLMTYLIGEQLSEAAASVLKIRARCRRFAGRNCSAAID